MGSISDCLLLAQTTYSVFDVKQKSIDGLMVLMTNNEYFFQYY